MLSSDPLARFIEAARAAGCPRDQVARFLAAGYAPLPKQLEFHAAARAADAEGFADRIALGGARGPGKSHAIFAQLAIDDCQRFPGVNCLYLRKVGKAAKESLENLTNKLLANIPHRLNSREGVISFPNGSKIISGHFQTERDIDNYLGLEYQIMAIEEMTQLTPNKLELLRGSRRSSVEGLRPREYASTNPGGVGHASFRKTFVLPHRERRETNTRFIPASWQDNPWLDAGYIRYLQGLTGVLGKMWRDGEWDIGAGAYFVHWDYNAHVLPASEIATPLPSSQPLWAGFDYGFSHPTSVHFYTSNQSRIKFTVAEHVQQYWLPAQHAAALRDIADRLGRDVSKITFYAGHDCFTRESSGQTIADQYRELGINLTRANVNRQAGAAAMLAALGDPTRADAQPRWFILDNCPRLIETLPAMQTDAKRPMDVVKIDADESGDGGDDAYDSARYGFMAPEAAAGGGGGSFGITSRS